ncbi:MAG: RRXRR domain-containing protein, partial [Thermoplasmataceae archaeon]
MKEKQKLVGRNTCTPTDAPQVRSSVTLSLNREETLSEQSLKTPSNNPHVDLQSGMTGRDLRVPVINMRNEPLMPTTPGKARKLLKQDKARVISSSPF